MFTEPCEDGKSPSRAVVIDGALWIGGILVDTLDQFISFWVCFWPLVHITGRHPRNPSPDRWTVPKSGSWGIIENIYVNY